MMCKLKGGMDKGGHYEGNERVDGKGGNLIRKLKGRMDKRMALKMKEWMEKDALRGGIREGIMMWKSKG